MGDKTGKTSLDVCLIEHAGKKAFPIEYNDSHFTHILCQKGKASFRLGKRKLSIGVNDLSILLPASRISDFTFSNDFKAVLFFVSTNLMRQNNPDIGWGIKGFLFAKENPVVQLSLGDTKKCISNFQTLNEKYKNRSHLFHKEIVNRQLQILILEMWNIFSAEMNRRDISGQQGSIFERFLQLVQQHCMEEREVDFYAGRLFISSKYLTEVCKKSSDKTASEWIQNYTTQRIIILLENNSYSISEISATLNFSSPSFFSRYVRKLLGVSPVEYRKRNFRKLNT